MQSGYNYNRSTVFRWQQMCALLRDEYAFFQKQHKRLTLCDPCIFGGGQHLSANQSGYEPYHMSTLGAQYSANFDPTQSASTDGGIRLGVGSPPYRTNTPNCASRSAAAAVGTSGGAGINAPQYLDGCRCVSCFGTNTISFLKEYVFQELYEDVMSADNVLYASFHV